MSTLSILNDNNFNEFITTSEVPIFIDLWGEWCPPCKKVEPLLEDLTKKYEGKMIFTKLNSDENPKTVDKYHVMSLPTFLILNNNLDILEKFIGAVPRQKFEEKIDNSLKKFNEN